MDGRRNISRDLFFLIRKVQQRYNAMWMASSPEITKGQYIAMWNLREFPGVEPVDLAQMTAVDKATLTGILDRLERQGFAKRQIAPLDRRRRQLYLTESGERLLERLIEIEDGVNDEFFADAEIKDTQGLISQLEGLLGESVETLKGKEAKSDEA